LFTNVLKKSGPAKKVEAGVSGTTPRLAFDVDTEKFLLFWISDNGTSLKSVLLNTDGSLSGSVRTLKQAAGNSTYRSLNISTNQDTGNLLALITESNGSAAKLLGFRLKPDGTLQKQTALSVTAADTDLNSIFADSSFSDSGTGFAFWNDNDSIKRRKLSRSNGLASGAKSLNGEADANSLQTSVLFDAKNNQFIPVWTVGSRVRAMALSTAGAVKENPFDVATSNFSNALHASTSYDGQLGNAIVVWEDSTENASAIEGGASATFRIRAAIFFFEGASVTKSISIGDNFFSPANLTVNVGDTVQWTNNGGLNHTVTSGTPSSSPGSIFDSGSLGRGATFSFRFSTPGSYEYFCRIHGLAMTGTITVSSGGEPNPRY
jgi:plastocyanin